MTDRKTRLIAVYDQHAPAMAEKFNRMSRSEDIKRAFSMIDTKRANVLEIGCGNGRDAVDILKHTDQYLGIDLSSRMIELARAQAPRGTFEVQDLETWAFPDDLDLIFSSASLLHSPPERVEDVLKRAHAALTPGGVFYISLKLGEGSFDKVDAFGTRRFYLYTPDEIERLAGNDYETVWTDIQNRFGIEWFTIALKKRGYSR